MKLQHEHGRHCRSRKKINPLVTGELNFRWGMMQSGVSPYIAEKVLCEDTQTVRPCACDLLSTPKSSDFLKIRQAIF
jgi:hypothetical protein